MFLIKFILRIIANGLGVFAAVYFLPQYISFTGSWIDYLVVGAILAIANMIVRPILKIVSAPLILITLGFFLVVINMIILFGVDYFVEQANINGFIGYFWISIILAIINAIIVGATKKKKTFTE
jgi:putative membrane protein